ncbi:MAG: hypothetical protein K5751_07975 [Treponemataceae bacterium]|jgi:hypothetical protein|nr:hypothetical protein [Treponemataceae bacterium]
MGLGSRQNIRNFLIIFAYVLLVCAFFSCSPQSDQRSTRAEIAEETHTLKKETEFRRQTLQWTETLRQEEDEANTIQENEPSMFFSDKLRLMTGVQEKNIYPSLPDLGSMDISSMSSALYTKLTTFLTGLKNKSIKSDDSAFSEKYLGVIFLYELGFYPDISSWYIGTPFISVNNGYGVEDVYEIPVFMISKSGKFKCWISIDAAKAAQNEFLIKQIVLGDLL